MKNLIIIFNILLLSLSGNHKLKDSCHEASTFSKVSAEEYTCPAQHGKNQRAIEGFLTREVWADQRAESNTDGLTVSQVITLNDGNHNNVCSSFNDIYQEAFDEKNGLGEPANNITYYAAGNYYFVVITPRQSDNPNYITFGTSFLDIYNQNIELIKAYAF